MYYYFFRYVIQPYEKSKEGQAIRTIQNQDKNNIYANKKSAKSLISSVVVG